MSEKSPRVYLEDILTSISRIEEYTKELSFESFKKDQRTIDAVVRNLEVIGEAAKNMPEDFCRKTQRITVAGDGEHEKQSNS